MITPSNFRADPLGWAGNQIGHMAIPAAFAYWMSVIWFVIAGEFPDRWLIFGVVAAMYLAIEAPQGGDLADTLEDILIVLVYGGGLFIYHMREITVGSSAVSFDLIAALPLATIATLHFGVGMAVRAWQMWRG